MPSQHIGGQGPSAHPPNTRLPGYRGKGARIVIRIPRLFRDDPPRDGLQSPPHVVAMGTTGLRVFDASFMGSDEDKKKANLSLFGFDVVVIRQHFPKDLKPLDRFGESRRKAASIARFRGRYTLLGPHTHTRPSPPDLVAVLDQAQVFSITETPR